MSAAPILPLDGSADMKTVRQAVSFAPSTVRVSNWVEVRSVVVPWGIAWANYATTLLVGWEPSVQSSEPEVRKTGNSVLFAKGLAASSLPDSLIDVLTSWRHVSPAARMPSFQDEGHIYRYSSGSIWSQEPCWVVQLHDSSLNAAGGNVPRLPRGPVFHAPSGFFAEGIGDAAHQWTHDPMVREGTTVLNHYRVVIRDSRAWIDGLVIVDEGKKLVVNVEGKEKDGVYVTSIVTDFVGTRSRHSVRLSGDHAALPIEISPAALRVFLHDAEGGVLDQYETNVDQRSGRSLLGRGRKLLDPKSQELVNALEEGESQTVEFKAWLPIDREQRKARELLNVATAFANRDGGALYVGVTDDGEVVGTSKHLRETFSELSDANAARNEYAKVINKILNDGVSPGLEKSVEWIEHAGFDVLRIAITRQPGALHHLVENDLMYIRKGGSNKKVTAEDIERIVAERNTTP